MRAEIYITRLNYNEKYKFAVKKVSINGETTVYKFKNTDKLNIFLRKFKDYEDATNNECDIGKKI